MYVFMFVCMYVCMYANVSMRNVCMDKHTRTCAYLHIYIYIYMCVFMGVYA